MSSRWQENDLILRTEEGVGGAGRAQGWGTETQVCRAAASREGGHGKGCDTPSGGHWQLLFLRNTNLFTFFL